MIYLAFILTAIVSFYGGVKYDWFKRSIEELRNHLAEKADVKKPEEKTSVFLDPLDIVTRARMEQDEARKRLNPNE